MTRSHHFLYAFAIGCGTLIATIGILMTASTIRHVAQMKTVTDPARARGIGEFVINVTIQSVDPVKHKMVVLTRDPSTGAVITYLLSIPTDFFVDRKDAIMDGDTIISSTERRSIGVNELRLGMRGTALISNSIKGELFVRYLLVGDPPLRF